ncbi:hypothetical protein [Niveispirillum cyanobacteriorum]|uniref:hypothetical protein n=1 Tax=Niveispirillum cyanobacteriorum TaxID=1612173 RepID=UPI001319D350|nr:hypothetical protein [Niveispirillum cyanobacteriorum]GGE52625.1 hypothetical protein GCM10011317_08600 [Niveispirillum cyanobacteriorum]
MVIDMRTRLPHGHIATHAANISFHAQQLRRCADDLSQALAALQALDVGALLEEFEAAR